MDYQEFETKLHAGLTVQVYGWEMAFIRATHPHTDFEKVSQNFFTFTGVHLGYFVSLATELGHWDKLAGDVHPGLINMLCDRVASEDDGVVLVLTRDEFVLMNNLMETGELALLIDERQSTAMSLAAKTHPELLEESGNAEAG